MMETAVGEIDVAQLRALLEHGDPVTVLDIRSAVDRGEWAIPGSQHVDAYNALKAGDPQALAHVSLPNGQPIVTVCGMGQTAALATTQLRARGLPALTLAGGMRAWSLAWNVAEVPLPGSATRVVQVRRTGKGCLSYIIASDGEAAVLDASLDASVYLHLAHRFGWKVTTVLDTHLHADHLSRSRLLAAATGARLYLPATERAAFPFTPLRDGAMLTIGAVHLTVLSTPGHTPESASYLLDQQALFSGDTLFLVGVGRPDLEANRDQASQRAHTLYQSLQRLLSLPAPTLVLPGHTGTPVPFDGRPLVATLATVRGQLGAFPTVEDDFVEAVLARIPPTPTNHARIVALNAAGLLPEGDLTELEAGANRCAVA